ncbi:MAG: Gfo/Idh/MocA family oxidoreductase [Kiritimatiellae bacterium]|nr:Gfo/Idh/MocA family oxidoreductase [Kiritimatiellia bacterium]
MGSCTDCQNHSGRTMRLAVVGAGFWSQFQIPAWREIGGAEIVALCNRTRPKAETLAQKFNIKKVFTDLETLLQAEELDFIDIVTEVPAHAEQVALAAKYKIPVICQKPMGPDYATCLSMVSVCKQAGIPFFIHENFRWIAQFRAFKHALDLGVIGTPRRIQITLKSATRELFGAQPFSCSLRHSIITDMGCHLFDLARFYFGEPQSVYCHALRRWDDLPCESIMTAVLRYPNALCSVSLSEKIDSQIFVDGDCGSLELDGDNAIRVSTAQGMHVNTPEPIRPFPWVTDEQRNSYGNSCGQGIVDCHAGLFEALQTGTRPEFTGEDYLKTMRLVYAAVESTERNQAVELDRYPLVADL